MDISKIKRFKANIYSMKMREKKKISEEEESLLMQNTVQYLSMLVLREILKDQVKAR